MKTKAIYKSKTIIGAIITMSVVLFRILDLDISESEITQVVEGSIAVFGTLLAVYGRIVAEKGITLK